MPDRVRDQAERLGRYEEALPAYIYDLGGLNEHAAAIRAGLPPDAQLYYAVKANPDPELLRTVAAHVDGFEVSSGGELRHVRETLRGTPVAFGGPGKTRVDLAAAVAAGNVRVHVESTVELRGLAAVADLAGRDVDVLLRVNVPVGTGGGTGGGAVTAATVTTRAGTAGAVTAGAAIAGDASLVMGGGPSPFGMDASLLEHCVTVLRSGEHPGLARLRLRGLHMHLASGLGAEAALAVARHVAAFAMEWCAGHGVPCPEINLGGGMAVDYGRPGTPFDWQAYGHGLGELAPGATLRIEPGRAMTAYCGWYATRVLDVKRSHGEQFAIVAGGTHHLRTPAAKGHDQPFAVLAASGAPAPVTITGQLCTPKDVFARRVPAPPMRPGDIVVFGMAGAYAWNISHHSFLMHSPPGFYYL